MSVILFIVILIVLILVHELGHFIVAKWTGMRVDEFGVGFPPRALTLAKKRGTEYTINWLPFGGFVKIFGENPTEASEQDSDSPRAFFNKSKWAQAAVLIAGVSMNVLLGFVLYVGAFTIGMPELVEPAQAGPEAKLYAVLVLPDSPAETAGLREGDELLSVASGGDSAPVRDPADLSEFIQAHPDADIALTYVRGDKEHSAALRPVDGVVEGRPAIGLQMALVENVSLPPHRAVVAAAVRTYDNLVAIVKGLGQFGVQLFTSSKALESVTGPVGIVSLVGDANALGLVHLINFIALISLNLAVINLLPIPALDGGRLLFVGIEAITGSRIKPVIFNTANAIGFVLLILLMVAVTFHDVWKLVA